MGIISEARHYRLSSGLEVKVEQVPHLQRAAVVWIFPVGSHQEPKAWPGLAHLTEHMVFSGGEQFRDQQRLMPWIQKRGGRLNATTQQNYTAYYFEVDPSDLQQGLLRLKDMLTTPRFAVADILREIAVIDEEYRLYSNSPHALASAALHSQIEYPLAFADFHIGNAATFGNDTIQLGQALEDFYAYGYQLTGSQVWIASPLSCQQQYTEVSECFTLPDTPVPLDSRPKSRVAESESIRWQDWQGEISLTKPPGLGITQVITITTLSDWPILVELMTDTAPGSLSEVISQQLGYYLSVRVERHYHDNQQIFFTLWLEGADFSEQDVHQSLTLWQQWRGALSHLTTEQFEHYRRLAQAEALRLPAMEFLREHALGFIFTPSSVNEVKPSCLYHALSSIKHTALLRSRQGASIKPVECQGLDCPFQRKKLRRMDPTDIQRAFTFYPQPPIIPDTIQSRGDSDRRVPLNYYHDLSGGVRMVLRPAPGAAISDKMRDTLTQALSPVFSLVKHAGGKAVWQQVNGNDLLYIRFDHFTDLKNCVANIITYWPKVLPSREIEDYASLSLRELLQNMPSLLAEKCNEWMVSYTGSAPDQAETLKAMLSGLAINWQTFQLDSLPLQRELHYKSKGRDSATVLAFIPYPLISSNAVRVYQQLAGYYESAFYHQLREVEAVGYAVACRQRVYRDRWGLQIILQSSHLSTLQLYDRVQEFFDRLTLTDDALSTSAGAEYESCGDQEIDRDLQSHLPLHSVTRQSDQTSASVQEAHKALVEQVKRREGGWIFIE